MSEPRFGNCRDVFVNSPRHPVLICAHCGGTGQKPSTLTTSVEMCRHCWGAGRTTALSDPAHQEGRNG